ncbi:MAG: HD domain-containing protein [Pseudomonadota bacterium]
MNIPAKDACYGLIRRMGMLDHIAAHSIRVYQVASLISENILDKGIAVNLPLITAAALLHDITKTRSFETKENHAETGEQYLREIGYPEVGDIVGQHVRLLVYADDGEPIAAEIVNYADKRVLHDQIVSLEERMAYIIERYGGGADHLFERLQWLCDRTAALETKLFSYLDFPPAALSQKISQEAFDASVQEYQGMR